MWENDKVQFARLLCELVASDMNLTDAAKSMDCEVSDLNELLDRAHEVWEDAKLAIAPAPAPIPEIVREEYELGDRRWVWIGVNSVSVYVKRDDEGVAVDLYPKGQENDGPVASCWATYAECSDEE